MTVKHYLDMMCRSLQELMETRSDEIYIRMKADYMRVLGGVEVRPEAVMPREERHLRNQIMEKLRAADPQFKPISKGEIAPACGDETAQVESLVADDGESVAFESAPELVDQDTAAGHEVDSALQESIMQDQDDSVVSKSSPATSKHVKLLTPSSNELSDTELQPATASNVSNTAEDFGHHNQSAPVPSSRAMKHEASAMPGFTDLVFAWL
ncbi:hypothetical protein B5807_06423 [Epicoccum nigrum]|uniref:Uncharacterized protein n=1 Tax=Epicoccum nigrum TaxID=105696 RepID=A0A1Y2LVH0_EPING|nr:hypothetical protein B5807_06423 [Epicoccum nigrum]